MSTITKPAVGDKVSIQHPTYPGIWTVVSVAKVNATVTQDGRRLKAPIDLLIEPTTDPLPPAPIQHFVLGEIVRVDNAKYPGLYVVIADKSGDRVNIAKLGGNDDRYLRFDRRGLTRVDAAAVLV